MLCYIESGGKYLMLLRNRKSDDPNRGKWIGVGGKTEPGETPEEAARREIREETGLTVLDMQSFGRVNFISDVWEGEIMHLFLVTDFTGELTGCDEGELHWIDREKVFDLRLWDGDRIFLQYLMDGRRFGEMTLEYKGERLSRCFVDGEEAELFDVYGEDGKPAGYVASREYVHKRGLWHVTAHVWITRRDADNGPMLLLQLRAADKRLYPSCWDISAAGHIPTGETVREGAVRELYEELGIDVPPEQPELVGVVRNFYDDDEGDGYHDREYSHVFLLRLDVRPEELVLDPDEVEKTVWMKYDDVLDKAKNGADGYCLIAGEMEMLRERL